MNSITSFEERFCQLLGQKIKAVDGAIFLYGGVEDAHAPQAISMTFQDGATVCISCFSDGESITITDADLETVDMEELGAIVVRSLLDNKFLSEIRDKILTDFDLIVDEKERKVTGAIMNFESLTFTIVNNGDELIVFC